MKSRLYDDYEDDPMFREYAAMMTDRPGMRASFGSRSGKKTAKIRKRKPLGAPLRVGRDEPSRPVSVTVSSAFAEGLRTSEIRLALKWFDGFGVIYASTLDDYLARLAVQLRRERDYLAARLPAKVGVRPRNGTAGTEVTFRLDPARRDRLRTTAERHGLTLSDLVEHALRRCYPLQDAV
ncbi:MAG: hypothetical protein NVSMB64_15450 [Candidatus Velthaea sp.]